MRNNDCLRVLAKTALGLRGGAIIYLITIPPYFGFSTARRAAFSLALYAFSLVLIKEVHFSIFSL